MATDLQFNLSPAVRYEGPEFDEYCISEGKYLAASRDRTPCMTCPLSTLCQSGFEEQVRRIQSGENPSLTEGCAFDPEALKPQTLFSGLSQEQIAFVISKVPNLEILEDV
ncbi:MAG TPA: hypothetical protein VF471_03190 [Pseudoxanthomonas sp.]